MRFKTLLLLGGAVAGYLGLKQRAGGTPASPPATPTPPAPRPADTPTAVQPEAVAAAQSAPAGPIDDDLDAAAEAEAAAAAAAIGGEGHSPSGDPAMDPVLEAGGGEAEGFEQAEADLIANATHSDGHGDPTADAFTPEVESDLATGVSGDGDHVESTEMADVDEDAAPEKPRTKR